MASDGGKQDERRDHDRVELDVRPCGRGFVMTIGTLSFLLNRTAAEEILCLLADALERDDPLQLLSADPN